MNTERTDESSGHLASWTVHPTSSRASSEEAPLATVFTEGAEHSVRHANAAFCSLTAQPRGEIVNRPLDSILRAENGALRGLLDRVFKTGMPNVVSDVARAHKGSGESPRYFTAMASPIVNEHTEHPGLLVQVLDTTEQVLARASEERAARDARRANEALVVAGRREHELAERWNALLENAAEGIAVLDRSGRPILVNPVGRKLLDSEGQPLQEYVACVFYTVDGAAVPPERHPAARALAGERFTDEELVHHRADGSRCRLLFSGNCVRGDAEEVVLAINVYRDVTALRELEATREEYVALISHDLRNPLSVLLMNAQLLIERVDRGGEETPGLEVKYARGIVRVTRRLAAMVDDLYQSSQLESSRLEMHLQPADPRALIADLVDELGTLHDKGRIVLHESARDFPMVNVDLPKIHRALGNLVTNALKYSEPGSKVVVELGRTSHEVVFVVRDQGPGISADDLPHVFEKYHRGRVTSDREGMGLGLYITRRIVEGHSGRLSVASEAGCGSTFRIALPISDRVREASSSTSTSSASRPGVAGAEARRPEPTNFEGRRRKA